MNATQIVIAETHRDPERYKKLADQYVDLCVTSLVKYGTQSKELAIKMYADRLQEIFENNLRENLSSPQSELVSLALKNVNWARVAKEWLA